MAGTKEGGLAAAKTVKANHGEDFYVRIGAQGGAKSTDGGFRWLKQNNPEKFRQLSAKGGSISRRGKQRA